MAMNWFAVFLSLAALPAGAQSREGSADKFAVASVKLNQDPNARGLKLQFSPAGRLEVQNVPLFILIAWAYKAPFQSNRLAGGPEWMRNERYDIDATPEPNAFAPGLPSSVRQERQRAMLRALLADRFQLVMRTETKDVPVYAEVVAKSGLKLAKSTMEDKDCDESCHTFQGGMGRGLHSKAANLTDLALYVSNWTDLPVVDETGIQGMFQIDTKPWVNAQTRQPSPGEKAEDGSELADLTTVFDVFTQMGLRLEKRRAPIEIYTIERLSHPTAN